MLVKPQTLPPAPDFPPERPHLLSLPNSATTWGPSVQTSDPEGSSSFRPPRGLTKGSGAQHKQGNGEDHMDDSESRCRVFTQTGVQGGKHRQMHFNKTE